MQRYRGNKYLYDNTGLGNQRRERSQWHTDKKIIVENRPIQPGNGEK